MNFCASVLAGGAATATPSARLASADEVRVKAGKGEGLAGSYKLEGNICDQGDIVARST